MYEYTCLNCGKRNFMDEEPNSTPRKFCDRKCWKEYQEKKPGRNGPAARGRYLSPTPVPPEQCEKCRFGILLGTCWSCGYFEIMGQTRMSLHPEGLSGPCQEFEIAKKKRNTAMTVKRSRPRSEVEED